ncbi:GNAT family N-acetyltransferase [Spirosoma endophyticum]|uniref:Acetyltransferase (GNAT) family protein n=1 Tax=Spirosoma endophyticum TaxID=662367 RepID=A0A1I1X8P6_9BACT|nr:GNAT family N-acetyltransferase [Spirosoma endophyticum]SFE03795.1 Acetyltransferase (GNAT) family protein [Spirosoma endophyticum]
MTVVIAQSDADIERCLPAMLALRPHLTPEKALEQIRFQQANENFVLAFVEVMRHADDSSEPAPAVVGYRYMTLLYSGKTLYIDDLSTLPSARGKGYASTLLDFVIDQARQKGCQCVSLDSGQNPARYDAHRLYLNKRFNIASHHFKLDL